MEFRGVSVIDKGTEGMEMSVTVRLAKGEKFEADDMAKVIEFAREGAERIGGVTDQDREGEAERSAPTRRRGRPKKAEPEPEAEAEPEPEAAPKRRRSRGAAAEEPKAEEAPKRRRRGRGNAAEVSDEDLVKACAAASEEVGPEPDEDGNTFDDAIMQIMEEDFDAANTNDIPQDKRKDFLAALEAEKAGWLDADD